MKSRHLKCSPATGTSPCPRHSIFEGPCRSSFAPKLRPRTMALSPNRFRTASSAVSMLLSVRLGGLPDTGSRPRAGGGAGRRGRTQARGGPNRGSMPRGCAPSAEADQTWCYPVRRGMTRDRAGSSDVVRSTRNTTRGWRIGSISGGFQGTHGPIRAWTVQNLFRGAAGRASATPTSRPVIAAHGATGRADAANHGHAPDDRRLTRPPTGAAPARSPRTARGRCRRPAQVSTRSPPGGAGGRMAVPQRIPVVLLHHPVGGSCQGQDLSRAFHQAERVIRCRRPPSSPPRARPATPG